jgi:hypothetical protein
MRVAEHNRLEHAGKRAAGSIASVIKMLDKQIATVDNCSVGTGLRLCREGVENLRAGARPGFLARGLRKLALANLLAGRLPSAYKAYDEAKEVAVKSSALDQLP